MSYVPPHRRRQQQQQQQQQHSEAPTRTKTAPTTTASRRQRQPQQPLVAPLLDAIYVINLDDRVDKWNAIQRQVQKWKRDEVLQAKVERFSAIRGGSEDEYSNDQELLVQRDWDATNNARYSSSAQPGPRTMTLGEVGCALSHIALWQRLIEQPQWKQILILEDDAHFDPRFLSCLEQAWEQLPKNNDHGEFDGILYLGFSSRGERLYLPSPATTMTSNQQQGHSRIATHSSSRPSHCDDNPQVQVFQPEYGYHTHAYIITVPAAKKLLEHLPVCGPIDVWLADHVWWDIPVFCAVIAGEGWKDKVTGTYEGKNLVGQNRKQWKSDIPQSSNRHHK